MKPPAPTSSKKPGLPVSSRNCSKTGVPSFSYQAIFMFTVSSTWSGPTAIDGSGGDHGVWEMPGKAVPGRVRATGVISPEGSPLSGLRRSMAGFLCGGRNFAGRTAVPSKSRRSILVRKVLVSMVVGSVDPRTAGASTSRGSGAGSVAGSRPERGGSKRGAAGEGPATSGELAGSDRHPDSRTEARVADRKTVQAANLHIAHAHDAEVTGSLFAPTGGNVVAEFGLGHGLDNIELDDQSPQGSLDGVFFGDGIYL